MSKPHVHAGYPCLHCAVEGNIGSICLHESETVAEAQAAGWLSVEPDSEGNSWNYSGLCPVCCPLTGTRIAQAP